MNEFLHDISWVIPYRSDLLTLIFEVFTKMGYGTFIMFALALSYWLWDKDKVTRVALIVLASTILNGFLKDLWQNPRPDALFQLDPHVGRSFGMPSGHAQVSAMLWLWFAYEICKPWAWIAAAVLISGVAFSRIYLGMHDVEDILAGFSLTAITFALYRWWLSPAFESFRDQSVWLHVAIMFAVQLVLYFTWPGFGYSISVLAITTYIIGWLLGITRAKDIH